MRNFRVFYDDCLRRQPLLTKCVTSGVLFGVGDRLAQHIEGRTATEEVDESSAGHELAKHSSGSDESSSSSDYARTGRMMVWGGLGFAPIAHNWYNLIERVAPGSAAIAVAKKIAMDQIIFAPAISSTFYTVTQSLEGKSVREALDVAREKVPPTLKVNYMVWPLVHLFTFNVVPLQYRILYINFVSIGWSTFLSQMTNAKPAVAIRDDLAALQAQVAGEPETE
ncbi:hypothetical protein PybrP1_008428 [[Pythium] brassicae (nom. inval.)]|nr:hypothetical protein PybrP1_008428 [[Pythium] brassicae (nom. inval.)]